MSNTVQSKPTSIQAQDIQRYAQQGQDRAIKARSFSVDSTQPDKQENIKQLANSLVNSIDSKTQSQNQAVGAGNLPKPTPKEPSVSVVAGGLPKPTPKEPVVAGGLPAPKPQEPPVVAGGLPAPTPEPPVVAGRLPTPTPQEPPVVAGRLPTPTPKEPVVAGGLPIPKTAQID
ncbi:hypothetical protein [uncultured Thiothrix sp.]|uniref:hypothetical protein n=1 Tax=uncultured Thiothrix sp. TaxID=223185 RepID=UPI002606A908|nr:hypothetical protein [uncultured Thiothrix sp.]